MVLGAPLPVLTQDIEVEEVLGGLTSVGVTVMISGKLEVEVEEVKSVMDEEVELEVALLGISVEEVESVAVVDALGSNPGADIPGSSDGTS